jgi:hypothetical protein
MEEINNEVNFGPELEHYRKLHNTELQFSALNAKVF